MLLVGVGYLGLFGLRLIRKYWSVQGGLLRCVGEEEAAGKRGRSQVSEEVSDARDLPRVWFLGATNEQEGGSWRQFGSGSEGETQERAGTGEEVVDPVSKDEEAGEEG